MAKQPLVWVRLPLGQTQHRWDLKVGATCETYLLKTAEKNKKGVNIASIGTEGIYIHVCTVHVTNDQMFTMVTIKNCYNNETIKNQSQKSNRQLLNTCADFTHADFAFYVEMFIQRLAHL